MPAQVSPSELPNGIDVIVHRVRGGWWGGQLEPGDELVTAIGAGAHLEITGAGEAARITMTRRAWLRI
eukprot:770971-Lingulodinium_polyedra.AAC.1